MRNSSNIYNIISQLFDLENPFYYEVIFFIVSFCILFFSAMMPSIISSCMKTIKKIVFINFLLILITTFTFLSFLFNTKLKLYWTGYLTINNGIFIQDVYTVSVKTFLLGLFIVLLVLSYNYWKITTHLSSEVPILLALSLGGILLFISSDNFIAFASLFIYLSLITSTLINGSNHSPYSAEGSIKNYIISGIASIFMVLSIFYINLTTQVESFSELSELCYDLDILDPAEFSNTLIFGIGLLFVVFLIKLGAAPFHQGLIDAYEASPMPVNAFLLGILKFAYFAFFIKLWLLFSHENNFIWAEVFSKMGYLSLIFGVLPAFSQIRLRRLLNYSTVANLGLVLLIFSHNLTYNSAWIGLTFMSVYSITIISIFGVLFFFQLKNEKTAEQNDLTYITDLAYIGKTKPYLGVLLTIFLFSLAGLPPFVGFSAKFLVLLTYLEIHMKTNHILLLLIFTVVPMFYYLRMIKCTLMDPLPAMEHKLITNDTLLGKLPLVVLIIIALTFIPGLSVIQIIGDYWSTAILFDSYSPTLSWFFN